MSLLPLDHLWVEQTLEQMDLRELAGQCLCPNLDKLTAEQLQETLERVPFGCVFLSPGESDELRAKTQAIQAGAKHPVLVAGDLEHGPNIIRDAPVSFPWSMAVGAANKTEPCKDMGEATAIIGRSCGFHWNFGPVADLNINPFNPVTNIRAFGDDPSHVAPLLRASIEGLQRQGRMAATAKHFPGDGLDNRDQHLVTSINNLRYEDWLETYGQVWKAAIEAGVWTIMSGHISLPAYQGHTERPEDALPATLCKQLQVRLLREELGFEGVIVSDAAPMIGMTSRCPGDQLAIRNLAAGSDVFLFGDEEDLDRIQQAVAEGTLSEALLRASARRVLALKVALGLHEETGGAEASEEQVDAWQAASIEIAESALSWLKEAPLPELKPGSKILTATLRHENKHLVPEDLTVFDDLLRERGFEVKHLYRPNHYDLKCEAEQVDHCFIHLYITPHMEMGMTRFISSAAFSFWRALYTELDNLSFTSFGSPYVLWDQPHLPNLLGAFSPEPVCQEAAAKAWLGELPIAGECPVRLPKAQIKSLQAFQNETAPKKERPRCEVAP